MDNRYRILHIVVSGFTQREGQAHGAERLYFKLRRFSRPDTFVGLRAWDDNPHNLARHIAIGAAWAPIVCVYPYSWGAGEFTAEFSEAMAGHNLRIDHIIAADPVYRSSIAERIPGVGHLMRGLGVLRRGDIRLGPTVLHAASFVQSNKIPRGGRFVASSPHTIIEPAVDLSAKGYGHNDMDEAEEWHSAAIACAERYQ